MHYKNGRPAAPGQWVIGPTHNSQNSLRIGLILQLMEGQGPCNCRIWIPKVIPNEEEDSGVPLFATARDGRPPDKLGGYEDFADVGQLVAVVDGWRMVAAVCGSGNWNAPYFEPQWGQ